MRRPTFPGMRVVATTMVAALPGLLLVVVIFGGIRAGIFTAVESAAVAVLYAVLVTALVYRRLAWREFRAACLSAAQTAGVILFVISAAASFGWLLAYLEVPALVVGAIREIADDRLVVLMLMNVVLLVLGTFMDMAPLIIICTPIFLPVATAFGVDPLHFGVILIVNAGIGLITPPVGTVLFVGTAIGKISIAQVDADDLAVLSRGARGAAARHVSFRRFRCRSAEAVAMSAPVRIADVFAAGPVIAVATIERAADAVPLARALAAGGVRVDRGHVAHAGRARSHRSDRDERPRRDRRRRHRARAAPTCAHARAAGAQFLVSPGYTAALRRSRGAPPPCRGCPAWPRRRKFSLAHEAGHRAPEVLSRPRAAGGPARATRICHRVP